MRLEAPESYACERRAGRKADIQGSGSGQHAHGAGLIAHLPMPMMKLLVTAAGNPREFSGARLVRADDRALEKISLIQRFETAFPKDGYGRTARSEILRAAKQ